MTHLLVRSLDPSAVDRLKKQAKQHGRSLQAEAKAILEAQSALDPAEALKLADRIRRSFRSRRFGDSAALIREERDR
jgi:plasmid stability protein